MTTYEELCADVRRRRRDRWAAILAGEVPGRPPGRRPRDGEQERLLLERDRRRLAARDAREGASGTPLDPLRPPNGSGAAG